MDKAIIATDLVKTYTQGSVSVNALAGLSLSVDKGEFLSIFGPSGSGKSTLLNLLGGLDLPSSGSVIVRGKALEKLSPSARAAFRLSNLGFVFQAYNLIPVLSAWENIAFIMELQGVSKEDRRARACDILAEVGLDGLAERKPGELSGGQQQRVAVARAIVSKPALVLADEPTANLDSKTAAELLELMKDLNLRHKITFIFSTHDKLVMENARRLVQIKDGKIV